MTTLATGRTHLTENFGTTDGPDIRFIMFTQGCRMRCQFYHDPDTWKIGSGSRVMTTGEVLEEALRFRSYQGEKGGITVSGDEPLLQMDFLIDLSREAEAQDIRTTLDTCGKPFTREKPFVSQFDELMKYTGLLLFDIKRINNEQHRPLITQSNDDILEVTTHLSKINKPAWICHVLVSQRSDYDEYLVRLGALMKTSNDIDEVEVLPYHMMGKYKWEKLDILYPLEGIESPKNDRVGDVGEPLCVEDY